MLPSNNNEIFKSKMSDGEFDKLSEFIYSEYGIKMPKIKKTMLESRLQKRLRELSIPSYKDYIDYVFSKEGQANEVVKMIDVVSTNKTDFFRESNHFDFLDSAILPELLATDHGTKLCKIWSAGCSSGEEPYTLAIVLSEFASRNPGLDFSIYATDISTRMLRVGIEAIYPEARIDCIPINLKKKYFLRSKDREKTTVRLIQEIRRKISFNRLNFMDNSYAISETFDVIFCRNVLIYFDRDTQERVINRCCQKLKKNGYFFLGHSESITSMNLPLVQIKPTIFKKI
jgi:chemotaxis protein methyltransferase CheR